ncbi:MAG: insulinase family protein [Caldilineaceae bacterium]
MYKKVSALLLLTVLSQWLFTTPAWAQTSAQPAAVKPIKFSDYELPLTDYTLANGLRVILAEDHSAPVVAVDTWFRVGGADDPANRSGFAHLFEHMMFEGSDHVANGQWDKLLEAIGASNNAYTQNDKTAFWDVAPANQLPRILWMESDRMASLAVTDANFQPQRQVVIQEYNQRIANSPFGAPICASLPSRCKAMRPTNCPSSAMWTISTPPLCKRCKIFTPHTIAPTTPRW